jgi:hypothetical protein
VEVQWTDKCDPLQQWAVGVGGAVFEIEFFLGSIWAGNALQLARVNSLKRAPMDFERHHWLIPTRANWLSPRIRDASWNRSPMTIIQHALSDPIRHNFMPRAWKAANPFPSGFQRFVQGAPWGAWGGVGSSSMIAYERLSDE